MSKIPWYAPLTRQPWIFLLGIIHVLPLFPNIFRRDGSATIYFAALILPLQHLETIRQLLRPSEDYHPPMGRRFLDKDHKWLPVSAGAQAFAGLLLVFIHWRRQQWLWVGVVTVVTLILPGIYLSILRGLRPTRQD